VLVMEDDKLLGLLSSENLRNFFFCAALVCNPRKIRICGKLCLLFFGLCFLASAENVKLYMKDGSYQLVREYKVQGDRVSFYSLDREETEEVPLSLVDLDKNQV